MTRFEFRMPDPGEGLTEATLDRWYVEEGDEAAEDDPLCDVETDKAIVELPVPVDGTVTELLAEEGDTVPVGDVLAVFETAEPYEQERTEGRAEEVVDEPTSSEVAAAAGRTREVQEHRGAGTDQSGGQGTGADRESGTQDEGRTEPSAAAGGQAVAERPAEGRRVVAAPSTRRYARERGLDLSTVEGSGPGGRVLRHDVDAYLEESEPVLEPAETMERTPAGEPESESTEVGGPPAPVERPRPDRAATDEEREVRRPLSGIRGRIAEAMVRSSRSIPQVTAGFEADATALVALRERLDEKHDVRITYLPILVKAVVPALKAHPVVNASVDEDGGEIVEKRFYDVGIATHTDEGVLAPVVRDADRKSIVEIAAEIEELAGRARDRTIDAAALRDATFTVTNLGTRGEHRTFGTPIINPPQAGILGLGRVRRKVVPVDGEPAVRPQVDLVLTYDHRIIDGVTANEFVEHVIESIEDTDVLLSRA